ncbi:GlsB/YeaQ/YmgE family stress response membrane protein [Pseudoxanthomonas sacheonensis]|uniref:Membrane protein YeaQ/YmgE (Transglycosylase-associated protein family) n=1 Tax=Pseudoxanthomonas sacheonensis TaxID=443615 RepID=A0ABU1RMH1_9GAMM|nr:GlsB/YeaQ/YmgE family stress response membrane protein [Pseudoxanthomonas sacheonensis]MDR6839971.1 putative membrane protein YeaQ/YmgE (transglycosylase-associated protein family) [Pseudoxanthomonas sacheonensis]
MEGLLGSGSWLYIIFIGFIVGLLARFLKPGNDGMGIILTILLGIAGAVLASFIGQQMGWYGPGQAAGFIGALVGAIVILLIVSLFRGKKRGGLPPR